MTLRRGAPGRHRTGRVDLGSEEQAGTVLREVLREEGDGHEVVFVEGAFWEYLKSRGLWVPVPDEELHRIVGSFDGTQYTDGNAKKTLRMSDAFAKGAIRRAAIQAADPTFFTAAASILVFANGAVRVTAAGEIERLDHSPEHRARAGYPFDYTPDAKCERFEQMQREHFAGDADVQEKIDCEEEFFGGCLFGMATTRQKCLAMPSDGSSGRSTLLEAIEASYPPGSVTHIDAKELRSAERRTRLVNKLLNFSDEVPPDAFLESEDFKKVVVGNTVTAEGKYRASFEFRPIAGHVFPIQNVASAELSTAFFRRFIIIRYNRQFENDPSRDYELSEKIIANEIPGIVARLIEGAARLRRQGHYTIPKSHAEEALRWRSEADSVTAFVAGEMVRATFAEPKHRSKGAAIPVGDRHDWSDSSTMHQLYETWCGENKRKAVGPGPFGVRLKALKIKWKHIDKGTYYGVLSRSRAERREKERAANEGRTVRPVPSFFDESPPLALVPPTSGGNTTNLDTCTETDRPDRQEKVSPSGVNHNNSDTCIETDRLTGSSKSSYIGYVRKSSGPKPVSLSGNASGSQKHGRSPLTGGLSTLSGKPRPVRQAGPR